MDLKEFISETISSIADATIELQKKYAEHDVLINPPSAQSGNDVYHPGSENYTYRRVRDIAFDVAVTAGRETSGGARAGLKVLSIDLGGSAEHSAAQENVSRVQFSIPMTLPPTTDEADNTSRRQASRAKVDAALAKRPPRSVV